MIYRMLTSVFMFGLKQAFKIASWRSPAFREQLGRASFLMQIKTSEKGRCYLLERGRWQSAGTANNPPDLLIEWKNARTALRCLLHLDVANIVKSHMAAVTEGSLSLEFNMLSVYRLGLILKQMRYALTGASAGNEA